MSTTRTEDEEIPKCACEMDRSCEKRDFAVVQEKNKNTTANYLRGDRGGRMGAINEPTFREGVSE